jgi:hypothetical protein
VSSLDVWAGVVAPLPELGPAHPGGYPPWSMAVSLLMVPPFTESLVRWYFAALNVLALFVVVQHVRRMGRPFGRGGELLLGAAGLAIAAYAITLRHGQYGLATNAFLVLMLAALSGQRPLLGGVFLALASLKPQTAAPFALAWLRRREPLAWAVAGAYAVLATLAFSLWLDRPPLRLVAQVFGQAAEWEGGDAGLLRVLLGAGVPRAVAVLGLMLVTLAVGSVLAYRYRAHSVSVRAALLCVVGRLWTYHRRYDDVMLVFLLAALGESALRRRDARSYAAFFAVGLTLWIPFREEHHGPLLISVKIAIWIAALVELLRHSLPEPGALGPARRSDG